MDKPKHPLENNSNSRPYMPTPEQFISSLDSETPTGPPSKAPKPRQPRRRRWRRVVGITLLVLLIAVLGYIAVLANNVAKISTQPLDMTGLATDSDGRTNILILGQGDPGHAGENLTDTMMVLSLDTRAKRVAQVSIPRDLRVKLDGYGYNKINAANALGGVKLAEQTVSDTLGIPIHYYVDTNFTGLRGLVDAVGGVDVNVKDALIDREYPCDDNQYKACGLDIKPGLQHMDGTRALQYARCRKGTCGDDFGRAQRQQEIIALVREKATTWDTIINPVKLTPLTAALRQGVTTDMGAIQMLQLALNWQDAQKNQPLHLVLSIKSGGYLKSSGSSSDLLPADGTFEAIQERVQHIFTIPPQPGDVPEQ
jgi:LCP family protein required for cell wall assembly